MDRGVFLPPEYLERRSAPPEEIAWEMFWTGIDNNDFGEPIPTDHNTQGVCIYEPHDPFPSSYRFFQISDRPWHIIPAPPHCTLNLCIKPKLWGTWYFS